MIDWSWIVENGQQIGQLIGAPARHMLAAQGLQLLGERVGQRAAQVQQLLGKRPCARFHRGRYRYRR